MKKNSFLQDLTGFCIFAKKNYKIIFECHQYSKVRNFVFKKVASNENVKIIFLNEYIRNEFDEFSTNNVILPSGVDLEIFNTPEVSVRVSNKICFVETYLDLEKREI